MSADPGPFSRTCPRLTFPPLSASDAYHTCYVLAGLTSAQTNWHFDASPPGSGLRSFPSAAFQWHSEPIIEDSQVFDEGDRIGTLHPVFVIPPGTAEEMRAHFASKGGF